MRSNDVVFDSPVFDNHASLCKGAEELAVKALVTQLVVKALDVSVLPRRAAFNVLGLHSGYFKPLLDATCDELRTIVAANELRCPMRCKQSLKNLDDTESSDSAIDLDGVTLSCKKVQHGEQLDRSAVCGLVEEKIIAPYLIPMCRKRSFCRVVSRFSSTS